MKRILIILSALVVFCISASMAEGLASLSDAELLELYSSTVKELESRGIVLPEGGSADEITDGTVLYYHPDGGEYYHLDPGCKRVNDNFLPLAGCFLYAELADEKYGSLKPCDVCGAPAPGADGNPLFATFAEAMDAADESSSAGGDGEHLVCVLEADGKYIRVITSLDDHAKELYAAASGAEGPDFEEAMKAFDAYAWNLPVSRTEEITAVPLSESELDALDGKTVDELMDEGFSVWEHDGRDNRSVVTLARGFYAYDFETDAPESAEQENPEEMWSRKVKNGQYTGLSFRATSLNLLADGTVSPLTEAGVPAEEADAGSVSPLEEYTRNAWPFTPETCAKLLEDPEALAGQVYIVEGTVMEVLSPDPLRLMINAGDDTSPLQVVVEFSEQTGFIPEPGSIWKFYGELSSSAADGMPVLTARWCFTR